MIDYIIYQVCLQIIGRLSVVIARILAFGGIWFGIMLQPRLDSSLDQNATVIETRQFSNIRNCID